METLIIKVADAVARLMDYLRQVSSKEGRAMRAAASYLSYKSNKVKIDIHTRRMFQMVGVHVPETDTDCFAAAYQMHGYSGMLALSEMCAALGFKLGDPETWVCLNSHVSEMKARRKKAALEAVSKCFDLFGV